MRAQRIAIEAAIEKLAFVVAVLAFAIGCFLLMAPQAHADTADVNAAAEGTMRINWSIDGRNYTRGTCFLINDDTVITSYRCVSFASDELSSFGYGDTTWNALSNRATYSVNVYRDVTIGAQIVKASEEMDFAILKLDQAVNGRHALTFADSTTAQSADNVWAIGYSSDGAPEVIETYTPEDAQIKSGTVTKSAFVSSIGDALETSVDLSAGDLGAPVVNDAGQVVAMARGASGDYSLTLPSNTITSVLNDLGVEHSVAQSESQVDPEQNTVLTNQSTEDSNAAQTNSEEKEQMLMWIIIAIVAAVLLLTVGIVALVLARRSRKQQPAPYVQPVAQPQCLQQPQQPFYLQQPAQQPAYLPQPAVPAAPSVCNGSLTRLQTQEVFVINHSDMLVGRDPHRAGICVEGNGKISRIHARLISNNGQVYIKDSSAPNGTFVNDVKVEPGSCIALHSGDIIRLANEQFRFVS